MDLGIAAFVVVSANALVLLLGGGLATYRTLRHERRSERARIGTNIDR